jgi:hypothetical protein
VERVTGHPENAMGSAKWKCQFCGMDGCSPRGFTALYGVSRVRVLERNVELDWIMIMNESDD